MTLTPNSASALAFSRIDECSIEVVTRCPENRRAANVPHNAKVLDSLPPEVRTISPGLVPNIDAMDRRASCNAAAAARPAPCALEGLPTSDWPACTAREAAGCNGAVAA